MTGSGTGSPFVIFSFLSSSAISYFSALAFFSETYPFSLTIFLNSRSTSCLSFACLFLSTLDSLVSESFSSGSPTGSGGGRSSSGFFFGLTFLTGFSSGLCLTTPRTASFTASSIGFSPTGSVLATSVGFTSRASSSSVSGAGSRPTFSLRRFNTGGAFGFSIELGTFGGAGGGGKGFRSGSKAFPTSAAWVGFGAPSSTASCSSVRMSSGSPSSGDSAFFGLGFFFGLASFWGSSTGDASGVSSFTDDSTGSDASCFLGAMSAIVSFSPSGLLSSERVRIESSLIASFSSSLGITLCTSGGSSPLTGSSSAFGSGCISLAAGLAGFSFFCLALVRGFFFPGADFFFFLAANGLPLIAYTANTPSPALASAPHQRYSRDFSFKKLLEVL